MSSWCCSTCPNPNPLPPVSVGVNATIYPRVTAAPYTLHAKDSPTGTARWYAPVFMEDPGACISVHGTIQPVTLNLCDPSSTEITVYALMTSVDSFQPMRYMSQPAGFPILSPRSCLMRVCTTSSDNIQQNRDVNIRINVQNGTWCKTPMSSSEHLEYSKAMHGVRNVYVASDCC